MNGEFSVLNRQYENQELNRYLSALDKELTCIESINTQIDEIKTMIGVLNTLIEDLRTEKVRAIQEGRV